VRVHTGHSGVYQCFARNRVGSTSSSATLTVVTDEEPVVGKLRDKTIDAQQRVKPLNAQQTGAGLRKDTSATNVSVVGENLCAFILVQN